ncbi:hypothetical protein FYK55_21865 [Roseiconus nitratireducens]|uniref:Uncharacterized protein n=1 Tax=Roseiconus nitratireducens TaxID=2605748 RepID=A0A5M6CZI0_9BACT|nr:hypothetical protein [Roseiconus nitratireducens]KAA5540276.1 hypothetical protein FYK55_21865 [Roseiconus nitratireducens]
MSSREAIVAQLERIDEIRGEIRELREAVTAVNSQCEEEAAKCVQRCERPRAELEDPTTESGRRIEARREIAQANADLERRIEELHAQRKHLTGEIGRLEKQTSNSQSLKNQLMQAAPDEQKDRQWVLQRSVESAQGRFQAAQGRIREYESLLETGKDRESESTLDTYRTRLRRWKAEAKEASHLAGLAQTELSKLTAAMTAL